MSFDTKLGDNPDKHFVSPSDFFSTDDEKIKLNWFLFELAREIESSIRRDKRLKKKLLGKKINASRIGGFSVHYAKSMKDQILDTVTGQIPHVRLGYETIESYFPGLGDRLVDQILTVVGKAWEAQTEMCVVCPTRCISERNQQATMFDDPDYWD